MFFTQNFLDQHFLDPNLFLDSKFYRLKSFYTQFFKLKTLLAKPFFLTIVVLDQKPFWTKIFIEPKPFWTKSLWNKYFWTKKYLGPFFFGRNQTMFEPINFENLNLNQEIFGTRRSKNSVVFHLFLNFLYLNFVRSKICLPIP